MLHMAGGFMTGFGPSGGLPPDVPKAVNWNQITMDILVSLSCVLPVLALWIPGGLTLVLGRIAIIFISLVGVLSFFGLNFLSLPVAFTILVWFFAIAPNRNDQGGNSDLCGTPWEGNPHYMKNSPRVDGKR